MKNNVNIFKWFSLLYMQKKTNFEHAKCDNLWNETMVYLVLKIFVNLKQCKQKKNNQTNGITSIVPRQQVKSVQNGDGALRPEECGPLDRIFKLEHLS